MEVWNKRGTVPASRYGRPQSNNQNKRLHLADAAAPDRSPDLDHGVVNLLVGQPRVVASLPVDDFAAAEHLVAGALLDGQTAQRGRITRTSTSPADWRYARVIVRESTQPTDAGGERDPEFQVETRHCGPRGEIIDLSARDAHAERRRGG